MLISIFAVYSTCSDTLLTSYFTYTGTSFLKVGWGEGRLIRKILTIKKKNIDAINFNYFYAPEKVGGRGGGGQTTINLIQFSGTTPLPRPYFTFEIKSYNI